MQIYIHKNEQQLGPFSETKVCKMLKTGELSFEDLCLRDDDTELKPLSDYYEIAPQTKIVVCKSPGFISYDVYF